MRSEKEIVLTDPPQETPAEYQRVFALMDAYRRGEISWDTYRQIPHELLMKARAWRGEETNRATAEIFADLGLSMDSEL